MREKKRIDEVLDIVSLADKANILVENYSGGMRDGSKLQGDLFIIQRFCFWMNLLLGLTHRLGDQSGIILET